jgi:phytoene desaturase
MTRDLIVIGAGPGGLAAAIVLAQTGAHVTVLERQPRIGGRAGRIEAAGFRFDVGPTFFLYPQVLDEIFQAAGRHLADEVELIRLDPFYHLIFEGGGALRARSDPHALAADVARLSPEDAEALPRFMADNRAKLAAFKPVLERPFNSPRDLLAPAVMKSLRWLRPHRSLDDDLASFFRDPRVRLAFSFQSKYLGMSPFKCPSLFSILAFLEYEHGVFHPRGGCHALTTAMARVATDMGVRIRTAEPVEEILFEGRRATGVRTAAGTHRADAVVINADFAQAMTKLVPDRLRRRWTDRKLATKQFSCSTFMMYLGIEGRIDHLDHHTIFLAEDYPRNLAEIEAGRVTPDQPSLYVQNACVTDPELAPPGCSTLYVLVPVGHQRGHVDWARERDRYRALVLRRLAKLGLGDLERRIRFEKIVTPADWEHDMQIYRGATFNLAHTLGQMLHRRPRNRFEDLDRVFLVGGGTHPGSGLPVIFEGARITSRLVAEELGLPVPAVPTLPAIRPWPPAVAERTAS